VRELAVAMLIMGTLFTLVAVVFMFRGATAASIVAILIPSLSLILAGGLVLRQNRE
jgi:hypothetical protein